VASTRRWTIYLAQDKHLDYGWCGTTPEIEVRMVALLDYYLEQAEQRGSRWNLDGTIWCEVYRRHRGEKGARRLLHAIRKGRIGYAANRSVLLWGLLSTELAVRACCGSVPIQRVTRTPNRTVLIMENPGLLWGAASVLTACGFAYLGRGIYDLRAHTYIHQRPPYPLFWWQAPGGQRVLVHWPPYAGTQTWGGYAEAFELARLAGEKWDAFHLQDFGDRNTPVVYRKRRKFICDTVERYESYGDAYPISSILLLGTGWDNWTRTGDYVAFIEKFNAESGGSVRLVDARYQDFFTAAAGEIRRKKLKLPTLEGSFGVCWEEWAAHLGGSTRDFREAERLLRQAEAAHALSVVAGRAKDRTLHELQEGFRSLLDFPEHDMGGCDRTKAAISAGVRAAAAARALDLGRSLSPGRAYPPPRLRNPALENTTFTWRQARIAFDEQRGAVASIRHQRYGELVPEEGNLALGEFVHTLYRTDGKADGVFPEALPSSPRTKLHSFSCRRGKNGVEIRTAGERWGFGFSTRCFLHAARPWIDLTYHLEDGWSDAPQSVQFCFPIALEKPVYRYDTAGAVQQAGPKEKGGDDLPGANPSLFAAQTFAAAAGKDFGLILLTPDAHLVQFGPEAVPSSGVHPQNIPAQITSVPLINLTRNDWQFGQGGQRRWTFRYRLVLAPGRCDPLRPIREAQRFCTPPYLQVPGQKPTVPSLEDLEISFPGGPVTAFKLAEDGRRLVLRLWNLLDRPVVGSVNLPRGFSRAEICDALERRRKELPVKRRRTIFTAGKRAILTIAFRRK